MTQVAITFVATFIGGALGGAFGVWLAWRRLQADYDRAMRSQPPRTGL